MTPAQESPVPPVFNILLRPALDASLKEWAGAKIFQRGTDYFVKKRVRDLAVTKDARLLATISGSRKYIAALYPDENGELAGSCTCPYDGICKHLVALALAGRAALQGGKALPVCSDSDFRPAMLPALCPQLSPGPDIAFLKSALATQPRERLLELLLKACELDRDIQLLCATLAGPDKSALQTLVSDARIAIAKSCCAADFAEDYAPGPEYRAISKKLRTIVAAGSPEVALELASELFNGCSETVESCDQDGEVIAAMEELSEAAVEALKMAAWPPAKKLVWALNAILTDDFGYCDCLEKYLHEISDPSAWTEAADYLHSLQVGKDSWRRERLDALGKLALEKLAQPQDI